MCRKNWKWNRNEASGNDQQGWSDSLKSAETT